MDIVYDLKGVDERAYSADIHKLVPELVPLVQKFYDKFEVEISNVEYKSSISKSDARITFLSDTKEVYCELEIDVSNLGAAYLPPSERKWNIILHFKNTHQEVSDDLYIDEKVSSTQIIKTKETNDLFEKMSVIKEYDEWVKTFYNYSRAADIFLF